MDKEPFIVKSGKGHSIEIEQGSTHARGKRTYVAPQDEAPREQVVSEEGSTQERRQLDLKQEGAEQTLSDPDRVLQADPQQAPESPDHAVVAPQDLAPKSRVEVPEDSPAGSPNDGPVLLQEVHGDEDARADKAEVQTDRFVGVEEDAPPEPDMVSVPEPSPLSNRQKIEQLQASANLILVKQTEGQPAELDIEKHDTPEPELVIDPQQDDRLSSPSEETTETVVVQAAPGEDLPAELAGNLGFTPAQEDPAQSAFLARVRALRNNMSVTDDRLTKLQGKPPVKP